MNAGTSYDFTYYHNTFSPQFIEQWCELNSHRLIHPVFRMFQGELETVYEEKNMYSDDAASMMLEQITGKFLAGTPYAYPIVGSTENLKNPKLSEMEAFYKKYYVASNMGLVLSGDIETDGLIQLLERTFGRLERGVKPVRDKVMPPAINGVVEDKFLFPMPIIKMSMMLFRAPAEYEPDAPALKVAMSLLNNDTISFAKITKILLFSKRLLHFTSIQRRSWGSVMVLEEKTLPGMFLYFTSLYLCQIQVASSARFES